MRDFSNQPHWSYSALNQYLKCPLAYYFERVLKLPKRTTSHALVLGSAVHSALAHYHRALQRRETPRPEDVQEAFLNAWKERANLVEVVHRENRSSSDLIAQGLALVELHLQEPPPQNIVLVEWPMLIALTDTRGEYLEKPLLAIPDLITSEDEFLTVREIKTASRVYSRSEIEYSHQPTCYAKAVYELMYTLPAIKYTVLVKTTTPKVQSFEAVRNISDFGRLGDIIKAVDQAVNAGIFYPVESPMNCSTCPFFRPCREWTGPARIDDDEVHIRSS
jgi:putative RecB family exonuclease